jgi:hypothetical protein
MPYERDPRTERVTFVPPKDADPAEAPDEAPKPAKKTAKKKAAKKTAKTTK